MNERGVIRSKVAAALDKALNRAVKELREIHQARERRQHHTALDARYCLCAYTQSLGDLILCQASTDALLRNGHANRARQ